MTILFMPLGPREVRVMAESCLQASMFLTTASSRPERCLCPSLSIACMPYGCIAPASLPSPPPPSPQPHRRTTASTFRRVTELRLTRSLSLSLSSLAPASVSATGTSTPPSFYSFEIFLQRQEVNTSSACSSAE